MQAVDAAMRKLGFLMMLDDQDHVIWKAPPEADGAEISLTCPKDARDHLIRESHAAGQRCRTARAGALLPTGYPCGAGADEGVRPRDRDPHGRVLQQCETG
eukprot:6137724-Pyramimonas_sp.AAC.1